MIVRSNYWSVLIESHRLGIDFYNRPDQSFVFCINFFVLFIGSPFLQLCTMVDFMLPLHLVALPSHPLPRTTTPLA